MRRTGLSFRLGYRRHEGSTPKVSSSQHAIKCQAFHWYPTALSVASHTHPNRCAKLLKAQLHPMQLQKNCGRTYLFELLRCVQAFEEALVRP